MLKNKIFMVLCLVLLATFANARFINLGKYAADEEQTYYIKDVDINKIYYKNDKCIVEFVDFSARKITLNTTCEKFLEETKLD